MLIDGKSARAGRGASLQDSHRSGRARVGGPAAGRSAEIARLALSSCRCPDLTHFAFGHRPPAHSTLDLQAIPSESSARRRRTRVARLPFNRKPPLRNILTSTCVDEAACQPFAANPSLRSELEPWIWAWRMLISLNR